MLMTHGRLAAALSATAIALAPPIAAKATIVTAYYVSPSGSDSNNGLSKTTPFKTLEKAQSAMQHSSSIKTTYLLGGVYARTAPLTLRNPADNGESWLGYPGQTPVLDGNGVVPYAIHFAAQHVTIRWLTVQNFLYSGIFAQYANYAVIDSNTVKNIYSTGWNQAGIISMNAFYYGKITHNKVINTQYDGIAVVDGATDNVSNTLIDSNSVSLTCTKVADCGGIHMDDVSRAGTNILITNNVVFNYGTYSTLTRGIYLDNLLSNTTVRNNIVYGQGQFAFQIHGGHSNTVNNNIFDVTHAFIMGLYQSISTYPMSGNTFTCNIVYSATKQPFGSWHYSGAAATPSDYKNIYWQVPGVVPNLAPIVDSQPLNNNPLFVNAGLANYTIQSTAPASFCNFQQINTSTVGPLPNT